MIGIIHVTEGHVNDLEEWTTRNVNELRGGLEFAECNAVLSVAGADYNGFRMEVLAGSLYGDTTHTVPNEIMLIFRGEPFTKINMDLVDADRYTQMVLHVLSTSDFPPGALADVSVGVNEELQCMVAIIRSGGSIGEKMMECDYIHELPLTPKAVLH
jgi:hypothetical protein